MAMVTRKQLENITLKEIDKLAKSKGYVIKGARKNEKIDSFLQQQKAAKNQPVKSKTKQEPESSQTQLVDENSTMKDIRAFLVSNDIEVKSNIRKQALVDLLLQFYASASKKGKKSKSGAKNASKSGAKNISKDDIAKSKSKKSISIPAPNEHDIEEFMTCLLSTKLVDAIDKYADNEIDWQGLKTFISSGKMDATRKNIITSVIDTLGDDDKEEQTNEPTSDDGTEVGGDTDAISRVENDINPATWTDENVTKRVFDLVFRVRTENADKENNVNFIATQSGIDPGLVEYVLTNYETFEKKYA